MRFPHANPALSSPHSPFSPVKSTLFKPHQAYSTSINPPPFLSIVVKEIYDDVYSEEINESIRMEALCSPHFVEAMRHLYGVAENDFDRMFRRTSLDPHDINHYRFAKLIGDLHDTICFDASDENKRRIIKKLKERFGLK